MVPDPLLVMMGILLVLVPGAAILVAVRIDRLGAALRADLDARASGADARLGQIEAEIGRTMAANREEASRARADDREALRSALARLGDAVNLRISELSQASRERLDAVAAEIARSAAGNEQRLQALQQALEAKLGELRADAALSSRSVIEELASRFKLLADGLTQSLQQAAELQRERLDAQARLIAALSQGIEAQHAALRHAVEARLDAIQAESSEKLGDMQRAIDGELQSARDARLFDSVKRVSDSLDQVHKAVGEMQSIASGVGNLRALPRAFDSSR